MDFFQLKHGFFPVKTLFIFKFVLSGHKDSVTCTGFSHDGVYVATADLSGLIKVWKVETKAEVWSFECSDIEVSDHTL